MKQVTIDVEGRFIDNISGEVKDAQSAINKLGKEADTAQKEINDLSKQKVKPTVDADTSKFEQKIRKTDSMLNKLKRFISRGSELNVKDNATSKIKNAMSTAKNWAGKKWEALINVKDSQALAKFKKLDGYAKTFAGKTWTTMVKVKDLATAPLRGIKNMLFSIQSLVMAITAGLAAKQLILNPINVADAYSSAKISFSTLLGESQGQQMMNDLDTFAKATPFNTTNVIDNAQKMLAMGWDAENIISDMEIIGNAAAATGKLDVGLESIVRALSQIKTKGKLSTEELNQLAEAGIAAKAMLAEGLGYGTGDTGIAKMTKDLEDGKIASDKAITALLAGMQKYDGMMDSMANETVEGLGSQIADAFNINVVRRWGQGLQDGAKRGFGSVVDLLDEAEGSLEKFGDTVYEIGKSFSNWAADKFEKSIARILEITDSYDFKNANLGEKISMLWNGVIVDPLKEWWENGGQQKTAETAGDIGAWMGKAITSGLLTLFGVTDVFADSDFGESGGMSVAQSFAKGFKENFDGSAITEAFVDAIKDIWGALPAWAKLLVGGYGAAKVGSIGASLIGGISSLAGGISSAVGGFSIASSALPHLTSSGTGILGLLGKAGVGMGASTTGAALLTGTAGIAGGIAGAASIGKGGFDLYKAYKANKAGDTIERDANVASGLTTLGGVTAGAAAGAAIGSIIPGLGTVVGGLVGAGIGGVAGWFGGDKWATSIREAKYEVEGTAEAIEEAATAEEKMAVLNEAAWENMKRHMGDVKLSASEIERIADQLVWGDDITAFEQFSSAAQTAEASLKTLNTAAENTNRWMWKASLGVKFNEDEIESITSTIEDYIGSAKSFIENKHYEFTAAVSLLVDVESEDGKGIINSGNTYFTGLQEKIEKLGADLSGKVKIALEDGVITLNEQAEITSLQNQIAAITEKMANAETKAELELIKLKFGGGKLDPDSFANLMAQMETTLSERMTANDEAFTVSVSTLQMQLEDGAISQEEYDKQLQTLISGYTTKVDNIKAEILNVELDLIKDSYGMELGKDAAGKLQRALESSLAEGIHPIEWTPEQAREFLGVDSLTDDTALAISKMLGGVADQLELVTVDGKLMLNLGIEGDTVEDTVNELKGEVPESMDETITLNLTAEKNIQNNIDVLAQEFGINNTEAETILFELSGQKTIAGKVSYLAKEFGIEESEAHSILWKLTGSKSILNTVSVGASDFGIKSSYSFSPTINLIPKVGAIGALNANFGNQNGQGSNFRGGIVGGRFALGGRPADGILKGGTKFISVNEEAPEMIIPLSLQRRERATDLWMKTGELLNIPGFARGGIIGRNSEGFQISRYESDGSAAAQTVQVEVGGVKVDIHVDATGTQNISEAIKEQAEEIAETVAGILADAFEEQFENTPVRGGAA